MDKVSKQRNKTSVRSQLYKRLRIHMEQCLKVFQESLTPMTICCLFLIMLISILFNVIILFSSRSLLLYLVDILEGYPMGISGYALYVHVL